MTYRVSIIRGSTVFYSAILYIAQINYKWMLLSINVSFYHSVLTVLVVMMTLTPTPHYQVSMYSHVNNNLLLPYVCMCLCV